MSRLKNIDLSVYKNNYDIHYLCFPTSTNVIQLVQHKYMQSRYWIQAISNYTPSEIEYKLKINPVRITKSKYDYSPIPKTQRRSEIIIDNQLRFCKVFLKMNIDRHNNFFSFLLRVKEFLLYNSLIEMFRCYTHHM